MSPFGPPSSPLRYYTTITLATPMVLLAMVLQTLWSIFWEAYASARYMLRTELLPMYASYFEMWTPSACRRAGTLARGVRPKGRRP